MSVRFQSLTRICAMIGAMMLVAAVFAAPASAQRSERYASFVVDADTGQVLHARHADDPRFPASLTKVMTLYMVFDALKSGELRLDERLKVSRTAARQPPSNLRLRTGQTITVEDAVMALISKSANDVAVVLAERLGVTEERFAALMTVKGATLGLNSTRFYNASGLPDSRQLTTARDMARLGQAMFEDHPEYYAYFSSRAFTWRGVRHANHNKLLGRVPGVDGLKTGYTHASGFNLLTSAKRDGRRIFAVVMGGRTSRSRDAHMEDLIEAAFDALLIPAGASVAQQTILPVQTPRDPNAAALPTLNGAPFRVAEGDNSD